MREMDAAFPRSMLDDVEDRVFAKYAVTQADARLAVDYLHCFLDARQTRRDDTIILPQIADWAWHELVLDTARYRTLCNDLYGGFLDHAAKPIQAGLPLEGQRLRRRFASSMAMMREVYGLGLGERREEWLEAGWDRPRYRLRQPIRVDAMPRPAGNPPVPLAVDLGWLPPRLVRRFGLALQVAQAAVDEYAAALSSLRPASSLGFDGCSVLGQIAWEEHILWTARYAADCERQRGSFLDHLPRTLVPPECAPLAA